MAVGLGAWVELTDGRVARISLWDVEKGQAVAETISGAQIERPISFAETRWSPLDRSGLRVMAAVDPNGVRRMVDEAPTDIVVLALSDLGGRAETKELKALISPRVVAAEDWETWWRRTQVRLEDEPRIDATKAREKRYALASEMSSLLGQELVPPVQQETRRGRRMADGPQLKKARERARSKSRDVGDERLFALEFALATDESVDPTDRFMAAELGVWLERWTAGDAKSALASDILAIDLLRVPQHASRTLAVEWAIEYARSNEPPQRDVNITFRSAAAAGTPWWDRVRAFVAESGPALKQATFGILGWSIPGDEDAGDAKLKDDLPTYERRIKRAEVELPALSSDGALGFWDGAVHALRTLRGSDTYAAAIARVRGGLARSAWAAYARLDQTRRPRLRDLAELDRDAAAALIRAAPSGALSELGVAVVRWYEGDPAANEGSLRVLAEATGTDVLSFELDAALHVLARTTAPRIISRLFHQLEPGRTDELAARIVSLAVTALGDDPAIGQAMDRITDAIYREVEGGHTRPGPVTFSTTSWARFNNLVAGRLEDASRNEVRARGEAQQQAAEANRQRELAEVRATALTEARASAGSAVRQDSSRLAANLLKPVALAFSDSFEANNLEALRDRLLGVLLRAKIVPIVEVGALTSFDPARHQWVGEGAPPEMVVARSPGFSLQNEGEDGIVLIPARVVAPEA